MNKYWCMFWTLVLVALNANADPVTAFVTANAGMISAIGAAVSVVSAIGSGMAQRDSAKYNAQVAENNAIAARQQATANAEAQQRDARLRIGQMEANYASSGVSLEGSPLEILEQSARNSEMDRLTILYGGELRAGNYGAEAQLNKSRASSAMTSGFIRAGSELMSGAARYGQLTREPLGTSTQSYASPVAYGGTTDYRYID